MFCCSPPHLELFLAKPILDFDNLELYSQPFPEIVRSATNKHILPKYSSLRIDTKNDGQFKVGWDKQAQLQLQFCEPSREVHLVASETKGNDEHLWRILGEHEAHELRLGDRIKIGFTQLLVYSHKHTERRSRRGPQMQSQSHCRYCLSNSYSAQDPLLSLCKCNGSVKYLHLSCFRGWVMTRLEKQDRDDIVIYTYYIGKLQCEICRQKWPAHVEVDGRTEGLLNFEDADEEGSQELDSVPFIVLETETLDESELQVKVFIKINLENSKFYLGDNENHSDLAIETIGVSPIHCFIHTENHMFFVTDCGSTTGTLVSLHEEELFTSKRSLFLQYSQLLIRLGVEETFFACFSPEQEYKLRFRHRAK